MDLNLYGVIYKIRNKINGKVYIGQTKRNNGFNGRYGFKGEGIERVYNFYNAHIKYGEHINHHLYSSIKKHGFHAFEVNEEFDTAYSEKELNEKEKYWINYYKTTDKRYGYNHTTGGDGFYYGKDKYIEKLGRTRKPIFCIETNEVFLTLREAEKKTGVCDNVVRNVCRGDFKSAFSKIHNKQLTFEYIDLERKSSQPVICVTTNEIFKSKKEASEKYGNDEWCILKNCNGKLKSAGRHPKTNEKLRWEYALNYKIENTTVLT